jgi:hypothetical protein
VKEKMKRTSCLLFALALLVSLSAAPVRTEQACKPIVGVFEAVVVPPGQGHCPADPAAFCTAGRVRGGLHGDYQFVMSAAFPSDSLGGVPTILFFAGNSDVTLKTGDHVLGVDTGSIDLPPGKGGFASLITFSGGTGAMASTTGQIRLRGEFNAQESTTSGDYIGTICTP